MEWNASELALARALAGTMDEDRGPRSTRVPSPGPVLRVSETGPLKDDLSLPNSYGLLFMRHLFEALTFNPTRLFRWRIEHKLVQALILNHYCPGVMPVTVGVQRVLAEAASREPMQYLTDLTANGSLVKRSLGYGSGDRGEVNQLRAVEEWLAVTPSTVPSGALHDEPFVVQERVDIAQEFRVHSIETAVIPDLTFLRYDVRAATADESRGPAAFVQRILDRLPGTLIKDSLYGWDVALTTTGELCILETNPGGIHPCYDPGFHCSGYLTLPSWAPPSVARLLQFVRQHYGVSIDVVADAPRNTKDQIGYWWIAHCMALMDRDTGSLPAVTQEVDLLLSPEQNIFNWAIAYADAIRGPAARADAVGHARPARDARRVPEAPLVSDDEYRQLATWNRTSTTYPVDTCVSTWIEAQAARRPEARAVASDRADVTYRELNAYANRLAHYLRGLGVGPERCVGVCLGRNWRLPATWLGVIKAGGAYVPLDPSHPDRRLQDMVDDAGLDLIVTERVVRSRVAALTTSVLCLDEAEGAVSRERDANPDRRAHPDNIAYLLYTSGSTGRPKGVAVLHRGLRNIVWHLRHRLALDEHDCWLAVTTPVFDIAALELFAPLTVGGTIRIASEDAVRSGSALQRLIDDSGATIMQATPVTWQLLIGSGWTGDRRLKALSGGEPMSPTLAYGLAQRVAVSWNLYGPTETTIYSTGTIVKDGSDTRAIGVPLANTHVYVVDPWLRAVPCGTVGEICIGGEGVARGYWGGQSALTAERFVPDPFVETPGARLYRTGDLGRWRHDGVIECLGRIDSQVKVRGFRIELREIEDALARHPAVREAAVVTTLGPAGDTRLTACVARAAGVRGDAGELRDFLRQRLPEYMVPTSFVEMEALPRGLHGKLDRRALAQSARAPSRGRSAADRSATRTEQALCELWSTLFGVPGIGLDDDFVDLGGHSLLAMQCANRVRDVFGVELSVETLFAERASVTAVARIIDDLRDELDRLRRPVMSMAGDAVPPARSER